MEGRGKRGEGKGGEGKGLANILHLLQTKQHTHHFTCIISFNRPNFMTYILFLSTHYR